MWFTLSGATVCFIPDITKGNRDGQQATGQTAEDGSFTLQTYPHGEGVMPGYYKVTCVVFGGVAVDRATILNVECVVKDAQAYTMRIECSTRRWEWEGTWGEERRIVLL